MTPASYLTRGVAGPPRGLRALANSKYGGQDGKEHHAGTTQSHSKRLRADMQLLALILPNVSP
ncbi:hypothetical protein LTR81_027726, partial [Elasticomyces elasticus]